MLQIRNAWLVVDYACNNSCSYCYASKANAQKSFMSLHYARQVLDEIARVGVKTCLIIGGEPTIHPNLFEIIEYGASVGLTMKIVSNGRAFKNMSFLLKSINAGLQHISISLEGSTPERHDGICGKGSFDDTLLGIKNCVSTKISMNVVSTISNHTKQDIVGIAELMHSLSVKNILFNYGVPPVFSEEHQEEGMFLSPEDLAHVAIDAYKKLREKKIKVRFFGTIPVCAYGSEKTQMMEEGYISGGTGCHMCNGSGVVFEPNGEIIPCTHFAGIKFISAKDEIGDKVVQLDQIWNQTSGSRKRFETALSRYPSEECEHCNLWGKCHGGCPLLWKVFDASQHTHRI